jgi:hypothetical protein
VAKNDKNSDVDDRDKNQNDLSQPSFSAEASCTNDDTMAPYNQVENFVGGDIESGFDENPNHFDDDASSVFSETFSTCSFSSTDS